jgi:hypothetical protein
VIVRPDLPPGLLAAQIVHAVGESVETPHPSGAHAIVLQADEAALIALEQRLLAVAVPHHAVREDDGMLTAIGIKPGRRSALRRHFSSLPLLR